MNVTKADIVDKIANETGLTKLETKAVVDGLLLSIIEALSEGKRIELRGFGVFSVRSRKPRMARNPRTGDPVPLEEKFIPAFKVSSEFQDKVHERLGSASAETLAQLDRDSGSSDHP
ncbi:MAG: integration host factor subunit beta [Candidatus Kapabacteria bacterium]|nr:integration host factor subunit beta [Candidatus Kapabacteria bacterium]